MPVITDAAFQFMRELCDNNNTDWFNENRARYERDLRDPMKALRDQLSGPVSEMVPGIAIPKISRINQDIRFHKDKPPYKEHVWIKWVEANAELMTAVGKEGWAGVVAVAGQKKQDLEIWRRNLVTHVDRWRAFASAAKLGDRVVTYTQNPYKKPLYDDIPDDVFDLVQSRGSYLVGPHYTTLPGSPVNLLTTELARLLPVFLFATVHPNELLVRLENMGEGLVPPDDEVVAIWDAVKGK